MNRPALRPVSKIVASLHTVAPPKKPIAEEARLVREFVSENLLLARMPSPKGLGTLRWPAQEIMRWVERQR